MGISFSKRRRDDNHHRLNHNHPPPLPPSRPPYYYPADPPSQQPPPQNDYSYTHNNLVSTPQLSLLPPPPPPPPYPSSSQPPPPQINHGPYGQNYYQNQYYPQQAPPYFTGYHHNGWNTMMRPVYFAPPPVQVPRLPYVEHQSAKKLRNAVNVNKATVKLEPDGLNPGHHLVSFVFDAVFDGSFTVIFFAKEESNCRIVPHLPEACPPTKVPFQKGTAQKFLQPSGTGTDLGFFSLDDLSKPTTEEVYPLVISAETGIPPSSSVSEETFGHNKQITLAGLEKTNDTSFKVKVIKQILWVEGERYELQELYGIDNSTTQGTAASDLEDTGGKECVICLTEPKDTAVMPCRHLCLCSDCAKELTFQSNKCPICREPIDKLLKIKVESSDEQH